MEHDLPRFSCSVCREFVGQPCVAVPKASDLFTRWTAYELPEISNEKDCLIRWSSNLEYMTAGSEKMKRYLCGTLRARCPVSCEVKMGTGAKKASSWSGSVHLL